MTEVGSYCCSSVVPDLRALRNKHHSGLSPAQMQDCIDRLVATDRALAAVAIAEAQARVGDSRRIATATTELNKGDAEAVFVWSWS